jgi:hypothetical protein
MIGELFLLCAFLYNTVNIFKKKRNGSLTSLNTSVKNIYFGKSLDNLHKGYRVTIINIGILFSFGLLTTTGRNLLGYFTNEWI